MLDDDTREPEAEPDPNEYQVGGTSSKSPSATIHSSVGIAALAWFHVQNR